MLLSSMYLSYHDIDEDENEDMLLRLRLELKQTRAIDEIVINLTASFRKKLCT
jgi:hypothetical protein